MIICMLAIMVLVTSVRHVINKTLVQSRVLRYPQTFRSNEVNHSLNAHLDLVFEPSQSGNSHEACAFLRLLARHVIYRGT